MTLPEHRVRAGQIRKAISANFYTWPAIELIMAELRAQCHLAVSMGNFTGEAGRDGSRFNVRDLI